MFTEKVHYKMRKRKKQWVVIGIVTISGIAGAIGFTTENVQADEVAEAEAVTTDLQILTQAADEDQKPAAETQTSIQDSETLSEQEQTSEQIGNVPNKISVLQTTEANNAATEDQPVMPAVASINQPQEKTTEQLEPTNENQENLKTENDVPEEPAETKIIATAENPTAITEESTPALAVRETVSPAEVEVAENSPAQAVNSGFDEADLNKIKDINLRNLLQYYLGNRILTVTYGYEGDNHQKVFENGSTLKDLQALFIEDEWRQGKNGFPAIGKITSLEGLEDAVNLQHIVLPNQGVADITPISHLKNIFWIDLSNNQAVGQLPNDWGNPELFFVAIQGNKITGNFGGNWQNLPKLTEFYADGTLDKDGNKVGNLLTGELPKNWNSIAYVRIANNNLTGMIPVEWVNQNKLNWINQKGMISLDLSNNNLNSGYQNAMPGNVMPSPYPEVIEGVASAALVENQNLGKTSWKIAADNKFATLDLSDFYKGILQADGTYLLPTTGVFGPADMEKAGFYWSLASSNLKDLQNRIRFENGRFILDLEGLPEQDIELSLMITHVLAPKKLVNLKYDTINRDYWTGIDFSGKVASTISAADLNPVEVTVHFVDDQDEAILKPAVKLGSYSVGETLDLTSFGIDTAIKGYTLTNKLAQNYLTKRTSDENNIFLRYTKNGIKTQTETKEITRTIEYQIDGDEHKAPESVKQIVRFTRDIQKDAVTDEILAVGEWKLSGDDQWAEVVSPQITGYQVSLEKVDAEKVDLTTTDKLVVVTYKKEHATQPDKIITPEKPQTPTANKQTLDEKATPTAVTASYKTAGTPASPAGTVTVKEQKLYPATGAKQNHLEWFGTLLVGLIGIAGFTKYKKKEQD